MIAPHPLDVDLKELLQRRRKLLRLALTDLTIADDEFGDIAVWRDLEPSLFDESKRLIDPGFD